MKTPLILILMTSLLISCGGEDKATAKREADTPKAAPAEEGKSREALLTSATSAAQMCLFSAHLLMVSDHQMENAKQTLAEQLTAGEAALKTIELQEVKKRVSGVELEYDETLEKLAEAEEQAGIKGHYSAPIKDFVTAGRHHISRWKAVESVRGFQKDDPDYEKYRKIIKTKLEDLVAAPQ